MVLLPGLRWRRLLFRPLRCCRRATWYDRRSLCRVLPIGGLKEKVLAAHRAGISTIIIPKENQKDMEEIPAPVARKLRFVLVEAMDEVLKEALTAPAAEKGVV